MVKLLSLKLYKVSRNKSMAKVSCSMNIGKEIFENHVYDRFS